MRRRRVIIVALSTLIVVVGLTGRFGDTARAVSCGSWTSIPSAGGNVRLFGVSAASPNDVWAVGHKASQGLKTMLEHWNGTKWTAVSPPAVSTSSGLNDVDVVASDDVWGVGYRGVTSPGDIPSATLVQRWNGTSWSVVPSANPPGTRSNSLIGISHVSSTDVWAVGYSTIGFTHQTLAEHWDGSAWSAIPSPNPAARSNVLLDVAAVAADDAWAAGYQNDGGGYRTLIEHWDGTKWNVVPSTSPGGTENVLNSLSVVSPSSIWAVGYSSDGRSDQTLTEHWDGTSWSTVPSANAAGDANLLFGTAFSASGDGWAIGTSYAGTGYDSLIEHWDGSTWTIVTSLDSQIAKERLWDVATIPQSSSSVWAVGSTDKSGTTMFFCPTSTDATASASASTPQSATSLVGPTPWSARSASPDDVRSAEPDVLSTTVTPFVAAQGVTAVDEAAAAHIDQTDLSYGAAVADYDGDGWTDFVYGRHFDPAVLYSNDANPPNDTFTQRLVFPTVDRHACAWGDVNGDGALDLFCGTGGDSGTDIHSNELWIQQSDHTFKDEAGRYGVIDPTSRGRRGVFVDANHDGWPDLWLGNVSERPDGLPSPNRLLINQGGSGFVDAPSFGLDVETNGGCGQAFDYNNDGYEDLLTCSGVGLTVYRNDAGTRFVDVTSALGLPTKPTDARVVDLNGDGLEDFVALQPGILRVYLQAPAGTFTRVYQRKGLSNAVTIATADVNGDNRPDLYVVTGAVNGQNAPDLLLLNDGTGKSFTSMATPQTTLGAGDSAYALDYDHNGLTDLLVTNGGCNTCRGPLQLIAFFPSN